MKKLLYVLLVAALPTYAAEPLDTDSPVMAPDVPGLSVRLRPGETAPFDGRLVSFEENTRRGRAIADCKGELDDAKGNVWVSKPVLVTVIVGALVVGAAAAAGVTAWAMQPKKGP